MLSAATRTFVIEVSKVLTPGQRVMVEERIKHLSKSMEPDSCLVAKALLAQLEKRETTVHRALSKMQLEAAKQTEEGQAARQRRDPLSAEAEKALDDLSSSTLEEYPFVRLCYQRTTGGMRPEPPAFIMVGTAAGLEDTYGRIIADGALGVHVFKHSPHLRDTYTRRSKGWTYKIHVFPYEEGARLRFWIHVDGPHKKGDHFGSRRFLVVKDGSVVPVSKEEYEAAALTWEV